MITNTRISLRKKADEQSDCAFGNMLFRIAGVIGVATKNGYDYGFNWTNQEFFANPLPGCSRKLRNQVVPKNFFIGDYGFDYGFNGFDFPDNIDLDGEFGTWKYFEHCEDLIRHYFEMKSICEPYKDAILIHFRDYKGATLKAWTLLQKEYYEEALTYFPKKRVIVVTDNIYEAQRVLKMDVEYTSNSPIIDFYLLAHADYLIMANSTFSWWGAYLAGCPTVAPLDWYKGPLKDLSTKDLYYKDWILI